MHTSRLFGQVVSQKLIAIQVLMMFAGWSQAADTNEQSQPEMRAPLALPSQEQGQPPAIRELLQRLPESPTPPTVLDRYIEALGDMGPTTHKGNAMRRSDMATMEIVSMGLPAVRRLIVATEHNLPRVRTEALAVICGIAERNGILADVLPVFARSLQDQDETVRTTAVRLIGRSCLALRQTAQSVVLRNGYHHLQSVLNDPAEDIRLTAALYLMKCAQTNMVPDQVQEEISAKDYSPDDLQ